METESLRAHSVDCYSELLSASWAITITDYRQQYTSITFKHRCNNGYAKSSRLAIARLRVLISPAATVYQCQLSMSSLQSRLMSIIESWGVNGHTMWCIGPVFVVSQLQLMSGYGLMKRRLAPPYWPMRFRKDLLLHSHMVVVTHYTVAATMLFYKHNKQKWVAKHNTCNTALHAW